MKRVANGEPTTFRPGKSWPFLFTRWVYILQSESTGRYYCGQTKEIEQRLQQHNDPLHKGSLTTKRFQGPWKLVWPHKCPHRADAMKLERAIKKRGIGRYLEELNYNRAPGGC